MCENRVEEGVKKRPPVNESMKWMNIRENIEVGTEHGEWECCKRKLETLLAMSPSSRMFP